MERFMKPTAAQTAHYRRAQDEAVNLIKLLESGIVGMRDGNGRWSNTDAIATKIEAIRSAIQDAHDPARDLANYVVANKLSLLDFRTVEKLNERFGHLNRDQVRRGLDWAEAAMSGVAA